MFQVLTCCSRHQWGCDRAPSLGPGHVSSPGDGPSPCLACRPDGGNIPKAWSYPSSEAREGARPLLKVEGTPLEEQRREATLTLRVIRQLTRSGDQQKTSTLWERVGGHRATVISSRVAAADRMEVRQRLTRPSLSIN